VAADLGGLLRVMVSSVMVADLSDMRASPTRPSARSCVFSVLRDVSAAQRAGYPPSSSSLPWPNHASCHVVPAMTRGAVAAES
jgi:hypothetical protein